MSDYNDKYVMCPFYLGQNRKKIHCEGIAEGVTVHAVFMSSEQKDEYVKAYCNSITRCCECPLHEAAAKKY